MEFEEKLKKLKKLHVYSDKSATNFIRQVEDRFSRLKIDEEWLKHPNTQALLEECQGQIDGIVSILANKEDLTEIDRAKLFAQKSAHLLYLATLSRNVDGELKSLENKVNSEITND